MAIEKIDGMSMDVEQEERDKLRAVFPQCFAEGKLDIDKLLTLCGTYMDDDFEKYEFKWKGKRDCFKLAQMRSTAALRPCREESVDFDTTKNLYIEGDNLEVLKLLQKAYFCRVKMIYIDPPYNTGNDFVYEDDFADTLANYKEVTSQATKSNPETMGRFHTNWLNMIYPRLRLAANLLRGDGVIFISIDDHEVHNLRKICDEVFGEENFIACFPWRKRTAKSDVPFGVSQDYEWIIGYAKSDDFRASLKGGTRKYFETPDLPGRPWRMHDLTTQRSALERPKSNFIMVNPKTGEGYPANTNRTWAVTIDTFEQYYAENRIVFPGDYDFLNISRPAFRYFKADDESKGGELFGYISVSTQLPPEVGMSQDGTKELNELFESKVFSYPKPVELIKHFLLTSTTLDPDAIILDFFSGSSAAAHAVMQQNAEDGGNRQFIMVQLPELVPEKSEAYEAGFKNICEIGKERIRRAGAQLRETTERLDIGFKVFKLDTSNLKTWDSSHISKEEQGKLGNRLNAMIQRVKPDRTDLDMVYEVMLKLGVPLDFPVTKQDVNGTATYSVGEDALLLVCLEDSLDVETLEQLADCAPAKMILAETSFADDSAMSNAYYTLRDRGIEFKFV